MNDSMNIQSAIKFFSIICITLAAAIALTVGGCNALDREYEYQLRQQIKWAQDACDRGATDACQVEDNLYDKLYEMKRGD